jgi:hypothetical protein
VHVLTRLLLLCFVLTNRRFVKLRPAAKDEIQVHKGCTHVIDLFKSSSSSKALRTVPLTAHATDVSDAFKSLTKKRGERRCLIIRTPGTDGDLCLSPDGDRTEWISRIKTLEPNTAPVASTTSLSTSFAGGSGEGGSLGNDAIPSMPLPLRRGSDVLGWSIHA